MDVPEGVDAKSKNDKCKLLKSLYGLKQASRQWNIKFDTFLRKFNLAPSSADPCIYRGYIDNVFVFLALYVDDGLLIAETKDALNKVLNALRENFKINDCKLSTFIDIQIERDKENHSIFLHQKYYIERILNRFGMTDANPVSVPVDPHSISTIMNDKTDECANYPYREAIGSLIYLAQLTRPDIMYAVNLLSRYSTCYTETHWRAVKRVFRYLAGTTTLGIKYDASNLTLVAYADADYAGDVETRRSTTGYIFNLSGGPISWCSQRQKSVSVSTTEAEYVAASTAARELVWLRQLLNDLECQCEERSVLYIDNQSAIRLIKNPEWHKRTKHIDIHFHYVREKYEEQILNVKYVKTQDQYADFLTKALPKDKFVSLLKRIGMNNMICTEALE